MSKFSQSSRRSGRILLEALEDRKLMSTGWGTQEITIGQDTAAINYPGLTGAGTVDRDYRHRRGLQPSRILAGGLGRGTR